MLSKKEMLQEEKDCAEMLGLKLENYRKSLKNIKAPKKEKETSKVEYDNSILKALGFEKSILKKKKNLL